MNIFCFICTAQESGTIFTTQKAGMVTVFEA